jgi:hypothetical protein
MNLHVEKFFILQHYFILYANPKFAYKKNFIKKKCDLGTFDLGISRFFFLCCTNNMNIIRTTWGLLLYK